MFNCHVSFRYDPTAAIFPCDYMEPRLISNVHSKHVPRLQDKTAAYGSFICILGFSPYFLLEAQKLTTWCGARSTTLWACVGLLEPLLATVKRWKLRWLGHVTHHDNLSKVILQGTMGVGGGGGGDAAIGRGNAGCCSRWPLTEKPERRSLLLNGLLCTPDNPIGQGTELS